MGLKMNKTKLELVKDIDFVRLRGLRRRIMLIMNNNKHWLSPTEIQGILDKGFRRGTIDRTYDFNTVCIITRRLHSLGLLDKRRVDGTHGRVSRYFINLYGIEQLKKNLESYNYEKAMSELKEKIRKSSKKAMRKKRAREYFDLTLKEYEKLIKKGCSVCRFKEIVEIHHKDFNRNNNDISNLIVLCPNHHRIAHMNNNNSKSVED